MSKLTIEDLDRLEELTVEELEKVSGGKTAIEGSGLAKYRLLKLQAPDYTQQLRAKLQGT